MNDLRALCLDLLAAVEWQQGDPWIDRLALSQRARAALAAPGPTDKEIEDWLEDCATATRNGEAGHFWVFDVSGDDVKQIVAAALRHWGAIG